VLVAGETRNLEVTVAYDMRMVFSGVVSAD
jgi:hypothetical protein